MKVLVTGARGQLGKDLVRVFGQGGLHEIQGFGREELDVTDFQQVDSALRSVKPDVVMYSSAYTAVDKAEEDIDAAYAVNAYGARNVAVVSESIGAKVCYVSTDYVFEGTGTNPYREFDQTRPQSVYGKSKLAGEELVRSLSARHFIVRTSWLYGSGGSNFPKTMLRLGKEGKPLSVVNDQIGSPTYTVDLANFLLDLVATEQFGVYHASNSGSCSWYDFAKAIFDEARMSVQLKPCTTDEFPRPAPRPKYSVLEHMSIRLEGFAELRPWRDGLRDFLVEINE